MTAWLGLDIGGANLKVAHSSGWNASCAFPMWKQANTIASCIAQLIDSSPEFDGVGVTMTGELADCFATRAIGVASILEQVTALFPSPYVRVYCVDGEWRSPAAAARDPWNAAASNWHALAKWSSRLLASSSGLLIDVGSTTTDMILLDRNGPVTQSKTDSQRLQSGELVYTGIERSNIAGIVREAPLFGLPCPVMNELFATTQDVFLWLGLVPENPVNRNTCDAQPATKEGARYRLARIVGEDGSTMTDEDIDAIAYHVFDAQAEMLQKSMERLLCGAPTKGTKSKPKPKSAPESVLLSGHGDFLVERVLDAISMDVPRTRLSDAIGPELSRCAPAYAVAVLASEAHD